MSGTRLAVWALLVVALASSRASAKCGTQYWVGAPPDGLVPRRGVVFTHGESLGGDEVSLPGVRVSPGISRVDFDTARSIAISGPYGPTQLVPIDGWRPQAEVPTVVDIAHREGRHGCAISDAVVVTIDQYVTAFRVRWTFDGVTTEFLEVASNDHRKSSSVVLGKRGCGGTSIPPSQLHAGGKLELFAIRFDGSEVPVMGLPDEIRFGLDLHRLFTCLGLLALVLVAPRALPLAPVIGRRAGLPAAYIVFRDRR